MNTLAISVKSAFRFFACGVRESTRATVRETPRVTAANRGSRRRRGVNQSAEKSAEIPPMSLVARRASRVGPRTHRLGGRHLLGLGLGLHRAQGLLEPIRLEVRLDGRDQVGGVRTHHATVGFVATASRRNQVCAGAAPKRGGRFQAKRACLGLVFSGELVVSRTHFS